MTRSPPKFQSGRHNYVVICHAEKEGRGLIGPATRKIFTAEGAAKYAATIHPGYYPRVVTVREYLHGYSCWRLGD